MYVAYSRVLLSRCAGVLEDVIEARVGSPKIQIELTVLFSVVSGGYDRPIEGTEANFPLTLVVL